MEAWKGMLWITFVMVSFAAITAITDVSLSSASGGLLLILAIMFAAISYWGTRKGYQIGHQMGKQKREEK